MDGNGKWKIRMKSDDTEMANINTMIGGLNNQRSAAYSQMQADTSAIIEKELNYHDTVAARTLRKRRLHQKRENYPCGRGWQRVDC